MMTDFQKQLAERAVREPARGGHIMETRSDAGDWYNYRMSDGTMVTAQVIKTLSEAGVIEPSGDGLFDDSQTYRLTRTLTNEDQYLRDRFGAGWVLARKGSKAAVGAVGRSVRKSELQEAKFLHGLLRVGAEMETAAK